MARKEEPILEEFVVDPYYILQTIALLERNVPSCKRSDILDLRAEAITDWWDRAVKGMTAGLKLLREECGVLLPTLVPYYTILVPLAAIIVQHPLSGDLAAATRRRQLIRWFWCSIFGQTYENASNGQSAKDVVEMGRWLDGGIAPESVQHFRFDPNILRDATPRQRSIYRGALALILQQGPRDFHSGRQITAALMDENHIDAHHLFPQAYLNKRKISATLRDSVLNRTLIDRETNQHIADNPPSHYLGQLVRANGSNGIRAILASHQLPTGENSSLQLDDFEAFLTWRQLTLWQLIETVTGVSSATALLED